MIKAIKYIIISISLFSLTNCGLLLNHKKPDFYTSALGVPPSPPFLIKNGYSAKVYEKDNRVYYYNPLINTDGVASDFATAGEQYRKYLIENGYIRQNALTRIYGTLDIPITILTFSTTLLLNLVFLPVSYIMLPVQGGRISLFIYDYIVFGPANLLSNDRNYYVVTKPYKQPTVLFEAIDNNEIAYNNYLKIKRKNIPELEALKKDREKEVAEEKKLIESAINKIFTKTYIVNNKVKSYKDLEKEIISYKGGMIFQTNFLKDDSYWQKNLAFLKEEYNPQKYSSINQETINLITNQAGKIFDLILSREVYEENMGIANKINSDSFVNKDTYFVINSASLKVLKNLPNGVIAKETNSDNLVYIEGAEKAKIGSPIKGTVLRYAGNFKYKNNGNSKTIYKLIDMKEYIDFFKDSFAYIAITVELKNIALMKQIEFEQSIYKTYQANGENIDIEINGYKYSVPFNAYYDYRKNKFKDPN